MKAIIFFYCRDFAGPPHIIRISDNQTVKEGNSLSLNCTAGGKPTPNTTWTKLSDNSVVTMPLTINRRSEGGYRCTADNKIGDPAIADVFVSVQCEYSIQKPFHLAIFQQSCFPKTS